MNRFSYQDLDDLIYENRRDSLKVTGYVNYGIKRAKNENNLTKVVHYFKNYVFYQTEEDRLRFIDSALLYAYEKNEYGLIGSVYLTKATVYYNRKDYQATLDNYLIANHYIEKTTDNYYKYRIRNHIAALKNYLGYYDEAAELFEECTEYFGQDEENYNTQRGYVSSLQGLAWSYTKTNRFDESNELLTRALHSAERAGFSELDTHYPVFKLGINDYYLGRYDSAIHKIEQKLPFLYENEDFAWGSIGEFYIGKSHWDKGDRDKAIGYFTKVDDVFRARNYTHPDLREAYELLINYYKDRDDRENQLKYIEQLVRVDSFYNQNHKHLISRIYKEYTTRDLILTQKKLEAALYLQKNRTTLTAMVAIFVVVLVYGAMQYRQRKARKAAQELIRKIKEEQGPSSPPQTETLAETSPPSTRPAPQLKDEVVEQLLKKLDQFEKKQKYLQHGLTLEKLANSLGTNTSYLSSVINKHKQKTFSEYLNSLRIEYLLNEVVEDKDSVLFKYSFDSLAKHLGYSSGTVFSRAFQAHTGMKPSVFMKELKTETK